MNPKIVFKLFSIITLVTFLSCERDWNNPWDEYNTLSPEEWAPQNLQIIDVTITEKKLTWTFSDYNIDGFKLDRKKGDDPWQVAYQTFPKETREWSDTGIIPDPALTNEYRLYAFAGKNTSSGQTKSLVASFAPPTNLQTEKLSDKSYKLTWTDNSTGEQGFKIDRKIDENAWITAFAKVPDNQTTFTDTNVFRATNVEYRVYGFYEGYESGKSSITTSAEIIAPTNLVISQSSISYITLTWQDNSNGEDGFRIERKYEEGDWELLATTKYNLFEDNNFQLNTHVFYRVCAYVGTYNSSFAEKDFDSQIPAPSNLEITRDSITSITVSWQDNSNGEEGFKIYRKYDSEGWELYVTTTANQLVDNNFELSRQVFYRVFAYFGQSNSDYLDVAFYSTIPAPSDLQITANSITSVSLTWQDNSNGEEGFKIDRKINSGAWEIEYATVGSNQNTLNDNNIAGQNWTDVNYKVYAFIGQYNSNAIENSVSFCGLSFTDTRDNHVYETLEIGNQCWMKENLAYLPSVSPSANGSQTSSYYYVYGYQGTSVTSAKATSNYQTYGVLYNWLASLTACPDGWNLPSDNEWTNLIDYLGGESVAGSKMKETGTSHWQSPNTGATNSSGFTGLPGGYRDYDGSFDYIGYYGDWWSSTEYSSTTAWLRGLIYYNASVYRGSGLKEYGFSVRCLRD